MRIVTYKCDVCKLPKDDMDIIGLVPMANGDQPVHVSLEETQTHVCYTCIEFLAYFKDQKPKKHIPFT